MSFTLCLETLRNCSTALEKCADDMSIINNNLPSSPANPGYSYGYWCVIFLLMAVAFGRMRL